MPFSPLHLILLLAALGMVAALVQLGALTLAFEKLGLSSGSALLLLVASLAGSLINLPLFSVQAQRPPAPLPAAVRGLLRARRMEFTGRTMITVNAGGCLVPLAFSLYLLRQDAPGAPAVIGAVAVVALVCRLASRPMPGVGIGIPMFVAPVAAALAALAIDPGHGAPLAYIAGTLGVLIGADLSRLGDIRRLGAPFASIGGAGTFDGIFLSGIVAVLLT